MWTSKTRQQQTDEQKKINSTHSLLCEWMHTCMNKWERINFSFPIVIIVVVVYQQFSLSVLITIVCPQSVANLYSHYGIRSFVEFSFDANNFPIFNISEIKSDTFDWIYLYLVGCIDWQKCSCVQNAKLKVIRCDIAFQINAGASL